MNFAEIIKSAFDANKGNLGKQDVFTPVDTLTNYFDFKNAIKNEINIGIMYNVEFLEYFLRDLNYINGKKFTYFYDSIVDRNLAFKVMMYYKYNNVELISIENIDFKNIETLKDKIMPKHFDVIFTNPPYTRNVDLKMLKMILDENIANKVIAVHPGAFLFGHNENNKILTDLKNTNTLKEVTIFWGNEMFETTGVKHVHCISVWDKNYKSSDVTIHDQAFTERKEIYNVDDFTYTTNVNDLTIHSIYSDKATAMLKKFLNCDSLLNHSFNPETDKKTKWGYRCATNLPGLEGKKRRYDCFYAFVGYQKETIEEHIIDDTYEWTGKNDAQGLRWYFNTKAELDNFINYLKLKCTRFLLSLNKNVADLTTGRVLRTVPWMDFTKHYSEEDLKKAWGIDEELWDYIDKFFDDYYEDYKEIAK